MVKQQLSLPTVEPSDRGAFRQWRLEGEGEGESETVRVRAIVSMRVRAIVSVRVRTVLSVRVRTVVSMMVRASISSERELYLILRSFSEVFKYNIFSCSLSV